MDRLVAVAEERTIGANRIIPSPQRPCPGEMDELAVVGSDRLVGDIMESCLLKPRCGGMDSRNRFRIRLGQPHEEDHDVNALGPGLGWHFVVAG